MVVATSGRRLAYPLLVTLWLAMLLWLLFPAPSDVSPGHGIQAHAPVEIVAARLHDPTGLAFDPSTGDLFIAEADTGVILRVDPGGALHTHATGFRRPRGLARDPWDGSLLVVDERAGTLSRIARDGSITRLRNDLKDPHWVAVDDGRIYVTAEGGAGVKLPGRDEGALLAFAPDGSNPQLLAKGLKRPAGLRVLPDGRIRFLADRFRTEPERDSGTVFELAPGDDVEILVRSGFKRPQDLTLDALEATYLTAEAQRREGHLERGVIGKAFGEESVALFAAGLHGPQGLVFDPQGNLYVAEADAGRVLRFIAPRPPDLDPEPPAFTNDATLVLTGTAEPNALLTVRGACALFSSQTDVSGQIIVRHSSFWFDHRAGLFLQAVTLTNAGSSPLAAPLAIAITAISPPGVTLANATTIVNDLPAIEVPLVQGLLRPGETARTILKFRGLPSERRPTYTLQIWVLRPLAVSDPKGHFSFPVILTPNTENHLELLATGALGLGLTSVPTKVTVTHDDHPPIVTLTSPSDGAFIAAPVVLVRGTVEEENLKDVVVNAQAASVREGQFEADVPLPVDGSHTLTVTARDQAGNTASASVTVVRDTSPPTLSITIPLPGTTTNQASITVVGAVADAMEVASVVVNGLPAVLGTGTFRAADVPLPLEGPNTVVVTATDLAGNTVTRQVQIARESAPPAVGPVIKGITPSTIPMGEGPGSIVLFGQNLSGATTLTALVNGLPDPRLTLTITGSSATQLTADISFTPEVPRGFPWGRRTLMVVTPQGESPREATPLNSIILIPATASGPMIVAIDPPSVPVGASLAILGVGFGTSPAENAVIFYGPSADRVVANVETALPSRLTVRVPNEAVSGPVEVQVGYSISNPFHFVVEGKAPRQIVGPVGSIQIGGSPAGVAVNQEGNLAVVTKPAAGTVAVLDLSERQIRSEIPVAGQPTLVAQSTIFADEFEGGTGVQAFVAGVDPPTLVRVNGQSPGAVDVFQLEARPTDLALSEFFSYVFVTQAEADTVQVLAAPYDETSTWEVEGTISAGSLLGGVATDDESFAVWVTAQGSKSLLGFEADRPFTPRGTVMLPAAPEKLAIHNDLRVGVVSLPEVNQVALVDLEALQVAAVLPVGAKPRGVAVNQERQMALVTNFEGNSVSVVDLLARAVIATVPTGQGPTGVAIHEALRLGIVTNTGDGTVTFIDLNPVSHQVTGFTPGFGPVGTLVTIQRRDFNAAPGGPTITFSSGAGRVSAPVISASSGEILTQVPDGATTGPVGVTTPMGTAFSQTDFLVTGNPLRIRITSPAEGTVMATGSTDVMGVVDLSTPTIRVSVNGIAAQVRGNTFIAPDVPLFLGQNVLTATVVDQDGNQATASTRVQGAALPMPPTIFLTASPAAGEAPLEVTFNLQVEANSPLGTVEMDFDGDGIVDRILGDPTSAFSFTYPREGVYRPTVFLTDPTGQRFTSSLMVSVTSLASLVQQWDNMKAALGRADPEGALQALAKGVRDRYRLALQALGTDLPAIAASIGDIQILSVEGGMAEGITVRVEDGEPRVYFIYLTPDDDGTWRILGM